MDKYITSSTDNYFNEKERRKKVYDEFCLYSQKLWEKYQKDQSKENHENFFDNLRKLDEAYIDWVDGVEYIYQDE